jgi:hypothetical protein
MAQLTHEFHLATTQNRQTAGHGLSRHLTAVAKILLAQTDDMVHVK